MNPNRKNRNTGRIAGMAIWVARIAAAALILVSNFALAWATSRSNGSKTGIDVKPPQLRSLHTKPPSMRHGPRAGHHPTKQGAKSHKHGQQSAQQARTQSRNSAGGKHGSHSRADTTPTPTPEELQPQLRDRHRVRVRWAPHSHPMLAEHE
ncbi:MAG: hypothetical protein ACM3NN_05720 [Nitrospirota bacterium]